MTANDSDVSDGDTLTGSQVVRVYGQNLTSPFVTLTFEGVEYTPLTQGEGYIEFILGDNGTATISVDGSPFMSIEVEGIVIPESLNRGKGMGQSESVSTNWSVPINKQSNSELCINYPFKITEDYPYFVGFSNCSENEGRSEYEGHNCTLVAFSRFPNNTGDIFCLSVDDSSKPAWFTYQGFIIAVLNYTTE